MKKLISFVFIFISIKTFSQTYVGVGNSLQRAPTSKGYIYRFNLGSPGFASWYTSQQVDSLITGMVAGVATFNGRSGIVVPLVNDYSSFYYPLTGNPSSFLTGITSLQITNALGFTPYNATNPNGYISGINSSMVTTALGFTPENVANKVTSLVGASNTTYPTSLAVVNAISDAGGGTVLSVSGVATNGFTWSIANPTTTPALTLLLQNATTTQSGQLTSTDWNTFNGKQNAITTGTTAQYFRGDLSLATFPSIYTFSGTTSQLTRGDGTYITNSSDNITEGATNLYYTISRAALKANVSGQVFTGNISATNLSGTNTGDQTSVTGNAGTATALQTARTINGVSFDGTANITVPAAAGTLTGTTLASNVVTSSLTSVGTLTAGSIPYSLLTGTPTVPTAANPTANVGVTTVNGSATTFMRSDAAPKGDTTLFQTVANFFPKGDTRYQNILTLTTTGTSGAATLIGSTLNIPNYASGGGSGTVTSITPGYGFTSSTPITTSGTLTIDTTKLQTIANFFPKGDTRYLQNVFTTTGDMDYSSSGTTPARLGIGTNGYFLTVVSGLPAWTVGGTAYFDNTMFSGAATSGSPLTLLNTGVRSFLSAGTGLTYTTGAFSVNSSQSITTLSNLTGNGPVYTSGGGGTLNTGTTTGSGTVYALATSPSLTTPTLGVATATTVNKVTITAPATSATLTLVQGSSLITAGAFATTLTSTATSNATIPSGTNTLYSTKSASITSAQMGTSVSDESGTGALIFADSPTFTTLVTLPAISIGLADKVGIVEGTGGRVGQVALVAGTAAITIAGLTTSSRAFITLVTPGGASLTIQYQGVCTSNTLTLRANVAAGTINVSDTSTLNYFVIN